MKYRKLKNSSLSIKMKITQLLDIKIMEKKELLL